MPRDQMEYDRLVANALRAVVRDALIRVANDGLPGNHHFYITFRTRDPGVRLAQHLLERYPEEMTIVLQHQFWDLNVGEDEFSVSLSFNRTPEPLRIPYRSITGFMDPSVQFGLQFQPYTEDLDGVAQQVKSGPVVDLSAQRRDEPEEAEVAPAAEETAEETPDPAPIEAEAVPGDENVITLDTFRKK